MRLTHDLNQSIALYADPSQDQPLWRYTYAGKPKPFFHPVCTPAGHCLTNFEPHDHLWHRGLWFTIKFVNGENFWEEEPATGRHGTQRLPLPPVTAANADGSVTLSHASEWLRPDGQTPALREARTVTHVPLAPDAYALDFSSTLTPLSDVTLDRTPYTTWGGYGGIILRGTRNWQQTAITLATGQRTERPTGDPAPWADLSGKLDGGPNLAGGFAILDHPTNPHHPTPWYGGAEKHQNYLNAAFLFHEPLHLPAAQPLTFCYRVVIHDGLWEADRLQAAYEDYLASQPHPKS